MTENFASRLNWVDVVVLVIFLRIILIALNKGLMIEIFKMIGIICTIFVSLHYYINLSDFISSRSPLPSDFADFISFSCLSVFVLMSFKFFRDGILVLVKIHPLEALDRWGSVLLGMVRGVFVASLILIAIFISTIDYLQESVETSYSHRFFLGVAPRVYASIFEGMISRLSPGEELNSEIFKATAID